MDHPKVSPTFPSSQGCALPPHRNWAMSRQSSMLGLLVRSSSLVWATFRKADLSLMAFLMDCMVISVWNISCRVCTNRSRYPRLWHCACFPLAPRLLPVYWGLILPCLLGGEIDSLSALLLPSSVPRESALCCCRCPTTLESWPQASFPNSQLGVKPDRVGVFTPQILANATNRSFSPAPDHWLLKIYWHICV